MTLKKRYLFACLVLAISLTAGSHLKAQNIELTPIIGYETAAKINTSSGDLRINDGLVYGGALNVGLGGGRYAEFSYTHMASDLSIEGIVREDICDLAVDYYSLGALQELMPGAKATPYGLFTLGIVNYRPTSGGYSSENKMHVSLAGGVKIRASERVGIRLQARLLMPLYYAGTYFSVGTGGAGYGISGGIRGVQGDFPAGLFLVLK